MLPTILIAIGSLTLGFVGGLILRHRRAPGSGVSPLDKEINFLRSALKERGDPRTRALLRVAKILNRTEVPDGRPDN